MPAALNPKPFKRHKTSALSSKGRYGFLLKSLFLVPVGLQMLFDSGLDRGRFLN